jgi:hypothetical protein
MVLQGGNANRRVWIQHDLKSVLPANTTWEHVARATLKVYTSAMPVRGPVHVFAAGGPWSEATLKHSAAPATRLVPGTAAPYATQTPEGVRKYMAFDVTELVRDWLDGTVPNNGLVLVPGSPTVNVSFDTKEATTTSHPAVLDVVLYQRHTAKGKSLTRGLGCDGKREWEDHETNSTRWAKLRRCSIVCRTNRPAGRENGCWRSNTGCQER